MSKKKAPSRTKAEESHVARNAKAAQPAPRGLFARTEVPSSRPNPSSKPAVKATLKAPAKVSVNPQVDHQRTKAVTPVATIDASKMAVKSSQVVEAGNASTNASLNISALRNSFDTQAPVRTSWKEGDYIQLIQRLDQLQTEAFILKGKLLSETKDKFYGTNRTGWIEFCEEKLGMNYTTANQYIRVSQECDVMSHHHPKLGFEHFKALLPAPSEQRQEILKGFDGGSVKKLRNLVAAALGADHAVAGARKVDNSNSAKAARMFLRQLQNLHGSLSSVSFSELPPQMAWQVSVACSQVAASLMRASQVASGITQNDDERAIIAPKRAAAHTEGPKVIKVDIEG